MSITHARRMVSTMAALKLEGCQETKEQKDAPMKGHSRNGSIEKYLIKMVKADAENEPCSGVDNGLHEPETDSAENEICQPREKTMQSSEPVAHVGESRTTCSDTDAEAEKCSEIEQSRETTEKSEVNQMEIDDNENKEGCESAMETNESDEMPAAVENHMNRNEVENRNSDEAGDSPDTSAQEIVVTNSSVTSAMETDTTSAQEIVVTNSSLTSAAETDTSNSEVAEADSLVVESKNKRTEELKSSLLDSSQSMDQDSSVVDSEVENKIGSNETIDSGQMSIVVESKTENNIESSKISEEDTCCSAKDVVEESCSVQLVEGTNSTRTDVNGKVAATSDCVADSKLIDSKKDDVNDASENNVEKTVESIAKIPPSSETGSPNENVISAKVEIHENSNAQSLTRNKVKQKARKSSQPLRNKFLPSSIIKTVNLAPIANVKVKLPESVLELPLPGKAVKNARVVHVNSVVSHAVNKSPCKPSLTQPSVLPTAKQPPAQQLSPPRHATMNSRSRHHRKKRIRRWGKGDLPLRKPKKKRLSDPTKEEVPPEMVPAPKNLIPIASAVAQIENDNWVEEIESCIEIPRNKALPISLLSSVRPVMVKSSPTILQLLTRNAQYRPKSPAGKAVSLLRGGPRPKMGNMIGKTVAELLMESRARRIQVSPKPPVTTTNGPTLMDSSAEDRLTEGLPSQGDDSTTLNRRVTLRKRKTVDEEYFASTPGTTDSETPTPGSGSKKRKMSMPERVVSGGEKWRKGEEFDLLEADPGSEGSLDLPPPAISAASTPVATTTTPSRSPRMHHHSTTSAMNVAISLDPPVITMTGLPTPSSHRRDNSVSDSSVSGIDNSSDISMTEMENSPDSKHLANGGPSLNLTHSPGGRAVMGTPSSVKTPSSALRSVLLDQMVYTHPLLGRRPGISLLSRKHGHIPNGAIYPVTPPKSDDGLTEGQPIPASAPGMGSSSPPQRDIIPLCCCKINGACVSKLTKPVIYCQALDSMEGKIMGCCNKVSNPQLVRPAVKIPFMAVCEVHRKRLKQHQCCPGCGHFCTQGQFYQCRKEGTSSVHHFHKACQVFKNSKYYCPHCGEESLQFEVNLRLNEPRQMNKFDKTENDTKQSKAKMGIHSNTYKIRDSELSESVSTASFTMEGGNKTFSTAGLPFGPDRYSLERILYLLPQERPKKYRVLPKCMYGPAKDGDLDKVVYMLVDGYDPNLKFPEYEGQNSVHAAAIGGSLPVLHVLLQAGGEVNCIDDHLKTPIMYAAENNNLPVLKYLVRAGSNVHSKGEDGMTCLHLAAKAGHNDAMQYLLEATDIKINVQDDGGWTPIIWAAEHRHVKSVKFLLAHCADPNLKDNEENTGLHWAAFSGSVDIAEIFLNAGCDLESPNEHGDRPLHIAARQDHYECVVLFLARGGDVEARNNENEAPISCCIDQTSQVWMALRVNKQLKGFAAKRLARTERLVHRDITLGKETNPIPAVNAVDDSENPTDYLYVMENCETTSLNINRVITSLQSCNCPDNCSSTMCNCSRNSVKCWFDKDGRLLSEFNQVEPPLIFECNKACRCWTTCNNRVIQNGISCRLQMFRTSGRGWGIRTLLDIPQGSFICEYIGELISDSEADRREDDSYLFDLDNKDGETYCIDARKYGNVARFINHLCEPNIIPVKLFVEHQDLRFPRICFFSSREIKAQEELGFDYGEKFWMIKWKQFTCECGSQKCKYSSETINKTLEEYRLRHEDEEEQRD